MTTSFWVTFAEILTLLLLALLCGQVYRLWRAEHKALTPLPTAPPVVPDLSGQPDAVLADYIGELMAGTQEPVPGYARPERAQLTRAVAETHPKPAPGKPEAAVRQPDYPSVAVLLARRCDTSSA
ncbi:hypothetical protein EZI54_20590 [Marinobacter halodurans]|uniref:Uncharacterized protein n=1 Tax=Marinobacter halodurans TaxID=2528979 RepID=A0ABY1ZH98_9GAMM|nr:hypothetical protein [Marinobacter halodurans]TBW48851.1 hypothetical protein EZI54_20590 [Marinobacter halodurans]